MEIIQEEEKTEKRKAIMNTIFLVVLIIAVCALIGTIITIHKYEAMIMNPVGYSLEYWGIPSCAYFDSQGNFIFINATNSLP